MFAGNPWAGLCVGILATVLIQSSSTTTAIAVSAVGSVAGVSSYITFRIRARPQPSAWVADPKKGRTRQAPMGARPIDPSDRVTGAAG